ncbi:MAG: fumarate hydratase [Candidatus Altiarchaeales archaeon]|nr:fumarate hydratase [Candidatus Altiarchaeales archaeon]
MISKKQVEETVVQLLRKSVVEIPKDVESAIEEAFKKEEGTAREQLKAILENIKIARRKEVPACQDTGIPIFYVKVGCKAKVDLNELKEGIVKGVARATEEIPLRPNVVDPISRKVCKDNVYAGMPHIEFEFLNEGDFVEITALPKGAGSENMSALKMINPSEGLKGIKKFVIEVVAKASGNPCPPTIVGVGVGGSSDLALIMAKKAVLRPVGSRNKDEELDCIEGELKEKINQLGVGPMGLGGKTTCLAVHIEKAGCHTASLPVGVNIQCWTGRKATVRIR